MSERRVENIGTHARARYEERYGAPLTVDGLRILESRLRSGEGMVLRRADDGTEVRVVRFRKMMTVVVFAPETKTIKTFLPPESAISCGYRRHA